MEWIRIEYPQKMLEAFTMEDRPNLSFFEAALNEKGVPLVCCWRRVYFGEDETLWAACRGQVHQFGPETAKALHVEGEPFVPVLLSPHDLEDINLAKTFVDTVEPRLRNVETSFASHVAVWDVLDFTESLGDGEAPLGPEACYVFRDRYSGDIDWCYETFEKHSETKIWTSTCGPLDLRMAEMLLAVKTLAPMKLPAVPDCFKREDLLDLAGVSPGEVVLSGKRPARLRGPGS